MKTLLEINNLHATTNNLEILKGVDLIINPGEIHVIMGTNGSGKSTLSKVLTGHPAYEITQGTINFKQECLNDIEPEQRALKGLFLAFQYPVEIPGVSNEEFLRIAYNMKQKYLGKAELTPIEFFMFLSKTLEEINLSPDFLTRNVNEGFSGGEKKKNEILQMMMLEPDLTILDEADSGLDIDALRSLSLTVDGYIRNSKNKHKSLVIITHYQRLLDYINPDYVHIMKSGQIIKTGDANLAKELEEKGYEWLTS